MTKHYRQPGWFTRRVFNGFVAGATKLGISVFGSAVLRVRGRRSGEWRSVPVNVLTLDGARYLVAPRGDTQWSRNLRAANEGELRVGHRIEQFRATELTDQDKPPVLRAYLQRWKWEVGIFFEGVGPASSDAELLAIADKHPVFKIG